MRNAHFWRSLAPVKPCFRTMLGYFTRPGILWTAPLSPPSLNSTTSISTLSPETERKTAVGMPSNVTATWSAERRKSSFRAGDPDAAVPTTTVATMRDAMTSLFTPSSLHAPTPRRRESLGLGSRVLGRERPDECARDARVRDQLVPRAVEGRVVRPALAAAPREQPRRARAERRRRDDDAIRATADAFRLGRGTVRRHVFVHVVGRYAEERRPVGKQDRHDVVRRHRVIRDAAAGDVED